MSTSVHQWPRTRRAAIYARISADREGRELGVERQEEDCRKLADRLRMQVHGIYVDNDISASTKSKKRRPEYQRLIADAKAGLFDTILAYTSGRITRKPRENEDLIELGESYGIRFEYLRSPSFDLNTANGRMVARMLAAADANEAEQTAERVARAVEQRAKAGKFHGGTRPYCYEADGVTLRPSEVKDFKAIVERITAGESQSAIIRDLNARAVPSQSGKLWTVANLKHVLLKKRYVIGYEDGSGIREHSSGDYKAEWPGIISRADYELMTARFKASGQPWAHGLANGRKYLLSGLTRCGTCNAAMYGQARVRENGKRQRRYRCKGIDNFAREIGCGKVYRDATALDEFITEAVLMRFDSPEIAAVLTTAEHATTADELAKELSALNHRRKVLAAEHALKPYEDYDIMRAAIMGEINRVETELGKLQSEKARVLLPTDQPLRVAWAAASLEWRRDVIKLVVEQIVVMPGHPGTMQWNGYRFNPELIDIKWKV